MPPSPPIPGLTATDKRLLRWYDRLWGLAIPHLKRYPRLATGYAQRCLTDGNAPLPRADLWWQAASAGEAYLAVSLSQVLGLRRTTHLLVTTQTRQGYDILLAHARELQRRKTALNLSVRYLPFDRPQLMRRAMAQVRPRLAVLLETELWPGFMAALKTATVPLAVINARMSPRSHRHYRLRTSLWRSLRPEAILALSPQDAGRFASLFGHRGVATMPNIKFDRVDAARTNPDPELRALFAQDRPLVVLGSVRRSEEPLIESLLAGLNQRHPRALLALFPRHMERLQHWRQALERRQLPWVARSKAQPGHPVLRTGGVILWDTFGELSAAYALAWGAYVGGSLVPLGGQNFLEPLAQGLRPVIGPYWDNFAWVGRDVVRVGLVKEVGDTGGALAALSRTLQDPMGQTGRIKVRRALDAYLAPRRGGSAQAAALIRRYLAR